MKKYKVLLGLFVILATNFAFASNRVGNGGGAWVCRSQESDIKWIQLVDLFEAQTEFGLNLARFSGDYRTIVADVSAGMLALTGGYFAELPMFIKHVNNLSEGSHVVYLEEKLPVINDALYFSVPQSASCQHGSIRYEQIVNYENNGNILVQKNLFNALNEEAKAALVIHEAIYAFRRGRGDADSINSRRIVGLAFSDLSAQLFDWHLKFLEHGTAPVYPGAYDIYVSKINSDGSIEKLSNVLIGLTGWFVSYSKPPITLWARSNEDGFVSINVDGRDGFYFAAPAISIKLDDQNWYSGDLPANGWATSLSASSSSHSIKYSCESATFLGATKVHVICVDRSI